MRSDPFSGRYLFHVHTTYTDGKASVQEYYKLAQRTGLDRLIFLEHIRAQPTYDVRRFLAEVRNCAAVFGVPTLVGFEAKLLPGGALDITDEHAVAGEVIGLAEHGFPGDYECWRKSIRTALERCAVSYGEKPVVWVHPGLWLQKHGLLEANEDEYRDLISYAQSLGVRLEWNRRYGLLPKHLHQMVSPSGLVHGADAHSIADAEAALRKLPL